MKDVYSFVSGILCDCEGVKFIRTSEIDIEGPVVKIRLIIDVETFIQVFYNAKTETLAYSLIKEAKRIYGIDRNSIRDWHEHPYGRSHEHIKCEEKSFKEFLDKVEWIVVEVTNK